MSKPKHRLREHLGRVVIESVQNYAEQSHRRRDYAEKVVLNELKAIVFQMEGRQKKPVFCFRMFK